MICTSEKAVIIDHKIYESVKSELIENNCYFLSESERKKVEKTVINENTGSVNSDIVGKPAYEIAKLAGVEVNRNTKILLGEIEGVGPEFRSEEHTSEL